jgi:hypothetical protein
MASDRVSQAAALAVTMALCLFSLFQSALRLGHERGRAAEQRPRLRLFIQNFCSAGKPNFASRIISRGGSSSGEKDANT